MSHSRLLISAAALLVATVLPAFAKTAMLSVDSALYEGPGVEYAVIGTLPAGRFNLDECVLNKRQEHWCLTLEPSEVGWIRVRLEGEIGDVPSGGGATGGTNGGTPVVGGDDAGATPGDDTGQGDEGMSSTDSASLPGGNSGIARDNVVRTRPSITKIPLKDPDPEPASDTVATKPSQL